MSTKQAKQEQEDNLLITELLRGLSRTPSYACSSLTRLNGGVANFVFRGILSQPLKNNDSIIIKHAKDYVALNPTFKLSTSRCRFEATMLKDLDGFSGPSSSSDTFQSHQPVLVRTPRLFHFDEDRNTQILEDLPNALDLKRALFLLPSASQQHQHGSSGSNIPGISPFPAMSIGRALGSWLASFHTWTFEPAQSSLRTEMRKNECMQALKHHINYVDLVRMVEKFPEVLEGSRTILQSVSEMAAKELVERNDEEEEFGIIHGDFWTGNVLASQSDAASKKNPNSSTETTTLFAIDWELCQMGPRALDLGQMIAELYEVKHFKDIDAGTLVLQGFVEGYRARHPFSEEMAFRTAIHVGAHLICFGSTVRGWGTPKQVEELVRVGRDFIVKAWERDRKWFEEDGMLGCLFERRKSTTG